MPKNILIVVGITILFLGLAIQPSIATVQPKEEINLEPKDYLFQTIIDIANNPDVKNLLEKYDYDLFKVDIDRSVYRKLLLRNPRLFRSIFFTKPSISYEYLVKTYNNGIEITNLIGEDKVSEITENIEVTNIRLFDELNTIITNDVELSSRFEVLKEINNRLKSDTKLNNDTFPIICVILFILFMVIGLVMVLFLIPALVFSIPLYIYEEYGLFPILASFGYIFDSILVSITLLLIVIGLAGCLFCLEDVPIPFEWKL